jgi:hypothetical protein
MRQMKKSVHGESDVIRYHNINVPTIPLPEVKSPKDSVKYTSKFVILNTTNNSVFFDFMSNFIWCVESALNIHGQTH